MGFKKELKLHDLASSVTACWFKDERYGISTKGPIFYVELINARSLLKMNLHFMRKSAALVLYPSIVPIQMNLLHIPTFPSERICCSKGQSGRGISSGYSASY
jgi:hypothetical protein